MPTSFYVDLHGADTIDPAILEAKLPEMIGGATPRSIRNHLKLNRPIYARTAAYGHFGRQTRQRRRLQPGKPGSRR